MSPYRVLIVDDEPLARLGVEQHLQRHPDFAVVQQAINGVQALEIISQLPLDLAFIDIRMPELSGLELATQLTSQAMPRIIFITAYDQHAIEAFRVDALDYLLKPIDPDDFDQAISKARVALQRQDNPPAKTICINDSKQIHRLPLCDILYAVSQGNYVQVVCRQMSIMARLTHVELGNSLPDNEFIKISRSCTVAKNGVKNMQPLCNQRFLLQMSDGSKMTSSRKYWRSIKAWISEDQPGPADRGITRS